MRMSLEILDTLGMRIAWLEEAPLLEATRRGPDQYDEIRCRLNHVDGLGPGCALVVRVNGQRWCVCDVVETRSFWNADYQPPDNEVAPLRDETEVVARGPVRRGNNRLRAAYVDMPLSEVIQDLVHRAPGPVHCLIEHGAYPEGAQREFSKFTSRATVDNALETAGISRGQWVGADRIDASGAWAKDGDTIAGLAVDGVPWPDVRLMMIDAEETSLNARARRVHPETAHWSEDRYNNSGYKLRADAATDGLAALLSEKGVSHIELNPHRDATGAFDDRVDAYGRYIALVYGGGECFNAALVEQGLVEVYLYEEGRYHVPSHRLKEFFSYRSAQSASWTLPATSVAAWDLDCGLLEAAHALTCHAGAHVFSLDNEDAISIRPATTVDHAFLYRADTMRISSGLTARELVNWLAVTGNALVSPERATAGRNDSINAYGLRAATLACEWTGDENDRTALAAGALAHHAYPAPATRIRFFEGAPGLAPGHLVTVTGAPLAHHARRLPHAWDTAHPVPVAGRVAEVRHIMRGHGIETEVTLYSPRQSTVNPLAFLRRLRARHSVPFTFRLDDDHVGLDQACFHL